MCSDNNTKLIKINDFGDVLKNDIACAQVALNEIGLDIKAKNPNLPARQSKVGNILVDGGHNEDAARALAPKINNEVAVVAMMKDKNVDAYLSLIAPKCKAIYATQVDNARSMSASELALVAKNIVIMFLRSIMPKKQSRLLSKIISRLYAARFIFIGKLEKN